eukprot:CAMPEP_0194532306 /NCGR_PEP_ID=MMETSP0253-20130528/69826_1 /TAXON_ID=2966 /ORGANISM="Noctiluca scintillans" /LENGTH=78 /DNA_ID=CAMNT_0039377737 /DNA_START=658 /DNA_END=894 /DNA_ORIENTATION=+
MHVEPVTAKVTEKKSISPVFTKQKPSRTATPVARVKWEGSQVHNAHTQTSGNHVANLLTTPTFDLVAAKTPNDMATSI